MILTEPEKLEHQRLCHHFCGDRIARPQHRTFKMFKEWFQITVQGIVTDLEDGPLEVDGS